ncbi:hypothetical protein Hamer_G023587 [Homarus americanus]|uniref:Uncharacterized protein n=1 Tax=Homarus americanus TaxID=6706 RepID=A0A8J5JFW3_HOMAM|nr:hypothetical protein Hamer_G023587 [Homarus americanus]
MVNGKSGGEEEKKKKRKKKKCFKTAEFGLPLCWRATFTGFVAYSAAPLKEFLGGLPLVGRLVNATHPQLSRGEPEGVWKVPLSTVYDVPTGAIVPLPAIVALTAGLGCGLLARRFWRRSSSEEEHNGTLRAKYNYVKARLYEPCRCTKLYMMETKSECQEDYSSDSSDSEGSEDSSSSSSDRRRIKRRKRKGKKKHRKCGKKRRH